MNIIDASDNYRNDMDEYMNKVTSIYGESSSPAALEKISLANAGNLVALKAYADDIYYGHIKRKYRFRDSFSLYLKAANIASLTDLTRINGNNAYPPAFWSLGLFLVNYKYESVLRKCESIEMIDEIPRSKRLISALILSLSCLHYIDSSAVYNLIGRILREYADNTDMADSEKQSLSDAFTIKEFTDVYNSHDMPINEALLSDASNAFFLKAYKLGYVYACNNLASKEAAIIVAMYNASSNKEDLLVNLDFTTHVDSYIKYLRTSADKFEPYAANRLGLFYMSGEIISNKHKIHLRNYIDTSMAKSYWNKAIVRPDVNSAWAFFNLIQNFPKDYENIDLLNEHMEYIKQLNPRVYDIAIDL